MKTRTIKIGITGGIGSGKSEFCKYLKSKKFIVINADNLSKELLANDKNIKDQIIETFGTESYKNNKPDKKYLAEIVFSEPENVYKINSILHPVVIEEITKLIENHSVKEKIIFVEAALIYEAEMEDLFDYVVLITAEKKIRMQRKAKNDNMSEEEFLKRNENQVPDSEKKKAADFVFENNSSIDELQKKADILLLMLKSG
jgi:dephospho-CoA kinase